MVLFCRHGNPAALKFLSSFTTRSRNMVRA
jgi:hypothetical protein